MKRQLLKRLLSYARPHMGYLVLALISALISVSMSLYVPILTFNLNNYPGRQLVFICFNIYAAITSVRRLLRPISHSI